MRRQAGAALEALADAVDRATVHANTLSVWRYLPAARLENRTVDGRARGVVRRHACTPGHGDCADAVLRKQGALVRRIGAMRDHPVAGATILQSCICTGRARSRPSPPRAPRRHGYMMVSPRRLLWRSILAVADAFEAMTSDRHTAWHSGGLWHSLGCGAGARTQFSARWWKHWRPP